MTAAAMIRGQYYDKLPPRAPGLRELVIRAIETSAALHAAGIHDEAEYSRRDDVAFDARADLRAALMNLGLDKGLIDQLGGIL